jgi:hypothetical protein
VAKVERNWEKTGTIVSLADWIRKDGSVADNQVLAVIVMRARDRALSVREDVALKDIEPMMSAHLAPLLDDLEKARAEKRKQGARVKWESLGE